MKYLKLAIPLTASVLFLGCAIQSPKPQPLPTQAASPTPDTTALKDAIGELEILEKKIETGISYKGYSDIIFTSQPIIQQVSGDSKAVTAVKSALEGHKLASKFWQCDRLEGYEELHQCRGKALSQIFAKYPDIKAQAKVAVKDKDFSTISAELDKEQILQAIWKKTKADTAAARREISA